MSKFLSDTPLSDVLPPSIRNDESMQASLAGIEQQLSDSTARIAGLLLLSRLFDTDGISENASEVLQRIASLGGYRPLEENLLDLLAWQFHVDDYDIAKNYREKLEMVKASIQIHRKKGTKWAVKRAVEAALQDTELRIKEWFETDYNSTGSAEPRCASEAKTTLFASESECQAGCLTERHGEEWFEADYNGSPYHSRRNSRCLAKSFCSTMSCGRKGLLKQQKACVPIATE